MALPLFATHTRTHRHTANGMTTLVLRYSTLLHVVCAMRANILRSSSSSKLTAITF